MDCIQFLNSIDINNITQSDLDVILKLSKHTDDEVRKLVAEKLYGSTTPQLTEILLTLTDDEEWLVRTEACESLSKNTSKEAMLRLLRIIDHDDEIIVREYAACAINSIMQSNPQLSYVDQLIKSQEKNQDHPRVVGAIACVLYTLGYESELQHISELLKAEDYGSRCAGVRMLGDILNTSNKETIYKIIYDLKEVEETIAVKCAIDEVLNVKV